MILIQTPDSQVLIVQFDSPVLIRLKTSTFVTWTGILKTFIFFQIILSYFKSNLLAFYFVPVDIRLNDGYPHHSLCYFFHLMMYDTIYLLQQHGLSAVMYIFNVHRLTMVKLHKIMFWMGSPPVLKKCTLSIMNHVNDGDGCPSINVKTQT